MLICRKLGKIVDTLNINICPICGNNHFLHELNCVDHYATGEKFELLKCSECGFVFTQDAPDESKIGRYYETPDYISHSDTTKGLMNRVYHWVREYMLRRKSSLVVNESKKANGLILDIGTGTGYFSNKMKSIGWDVKAIEKNPQARDFAKQHFNLDVDDENSLGYYESGSFDVITLWHVMEHLQNLNVTWETLGRLLKDDGVLVVAVPNPTSYDANYYKEWWAAYDVPRHLWHFSPDVMKKLGEKHGFTLKKSYPMPFDAFYVSMLTEKYKKNPLSFLKGLWVGFCALISTFGSKEKSSSMIYIFIKS